MENIFEGQICKADYNPDKKWIVYSFNRYPVIEEHKAIYLKAMEFLKKNKITASIMDFRKIKGAFTMLNDWTIDFFRPAVHIGLKKSAMVLNDDIFTQFASNDAITKIN